jgi:hypothetical protein
MENEPTPIPFDADDWVKILVGLTIEIVTVCRPGDSEQALVEVANRLDDMSRTTTNMRRKALLARMAAILMAIEDID